MPVTAPPLAPMLDVLQPADRSAPLNDGCSGWWMFLPGLSGAGTVWRDLLAPDHGTLTNMAQPATSTSGWGLTTLRPGGFGELRLDGSDDYVSFGNPTRL